MYKKIISRKTRAFIVWMLVAVMQLTTILPMATVYAVGAQSENSPKIETTSGAGARAELTSTGDEGKVGTKENGYIIDVQITDKDGNPFDGEVKNDSEIRLTYFYSIPDNEDGDVDVDTNTKYTLTVPKEIEVIKVEVFNLMMGNIIVGEATLNKNNTITYSFKESVNGFTHNRKGSMYVVTKFNADEIGYEGKKDIEFTIPGHTDTIKVPVNFEEIDEKVDVGIEKKGDYDKIKNIITWKITITPTSQPKVISISDVVITDTIQEGQTYVPNSTTLTTYLDNKEISSVSIADIECYDENGKKLTYKFPGSINNKAAEEYIITFKTKANTSAFTSEGQKVYFKNKAGVTFKDIDGEPTTNLSKEASVDATVDFIAKKGDYVADGRKIIWTVTINNNNLDIEGKAPSPGAVITDKIPTGLKLIEDDPDNPIEVVKTLEPETPATGTIAYDEDENVFKYTFDGKISESYTLTYTTVVIDEDAYNTNNKVFTNSVKLEGIGVPENAKDSEVVGITTNVISKKGIGYDSSTHEITWKIIVNSNKITINRAKISDNIPIGLGYVGGSFKVEKNGTPISLEPEKFKYTDFPNDPLKTGTLEYDLGSIDTTYTITFKTKVLDKEIYAANKTETYTNNVTLTGTKEGTDTPINVTTQGEQTVKSTVITKEAISYDHISRRIKWKIVVNKNKMLMKNAYVKDVIGESQELVENSIRIDDDINPERPARLGANATEENSYYYDKKENILTYNFPVQIETQQIITFETKINDLTIFEENDKQTLSNTATLIGDDIPVNDDVTVTAKKDIPNTVVEKKGTPGDDYIDWEVNINQNMLEIKTPILEDTLEVGLDLDPASIKLMQLDLDEDGEPIESESIDVTNELLDVKYDMNTRMVTFQFKKPIKHAYRLIFTTDIEPEYRSKSFNNTIYFKGSGQTQSGSATGIKATSQDVGGDGSGENRGSITLIKVDEKNNQIKLEGAIFELLDMYMNPTKTSTSTVNGEAKFTGLRFGNTYYVKEIWPPTGYVVSDEPYEFKVSDEKGKKNITYDFKNTKIQGSIEFTKTGEGDDKGALEGATFSLYSKLDKETLVQTKISDGNGLVKFENVEYGKYIIKETGTPKGYLRYEDEIKTEIKENNEKVKLENVENKKIKGNIEFYKKDNKGKILPGAEFSLYHKGDEAPEKAIMRVLSDENGLVQFAEIPFGEYVIKETIAPIGYGPSDQGLEVTIKVQGELIKREDIINEEIIGDLEIIKKSESGETLEGAEFELRNNDNDDKVYTGTTDKDGRILFNRIDHGIYTLKETKAPRGHILNTETHEIEILVYKQGLQRITVVNQKIKGSLEILKVDSRTKRPLRNARFTLYDANMNKITEEITGTDGKAIFKDLVYGKYFYEETRAPGGYYIDKTVYELNLPENDDEILEDGFVIEKLVDNRRRPEDPGPGGGGPGPKDPVDPTDPTNPTDPVDPTDPTDPVDPTDPTDPVDPTDPTDPVDPTDPTDPVDPTNPTNPTDPTDPTDPVNPTDPTSPTEPPKYERTEVPNPNNPGSPDEFVLVDENGVPLGTYTKKQNPDGTYIYVDENGIPLGSPGAAGTGGPLVPQTGDNTPVLPLLIVFIISLFSAVYLIIFKRKRFNQ